MRLQRYGLSFEARLRPNPSIDGKGGRIICPLLSERTSPRCGIEKYLSPGEDVIWASRRHAVVLDPAVGVWIIGAVLGLIAALTSRGYPGWYLGQIGAGIFLTGTAF